MILSLIFATLVAQDAPAHATPTPTTSASATPSPKQPLLGVVPPRGYTYANGLPVPKTYRLWTIGEKPNRSGIIVLLFPGYAGTSKDYAENKFLPDVESESTNTSYQVTGERPITFCGGPGWEMREVFTADETAHSNLYFSLHRNT